MKRFAVGLLLVSGLVCGCRVHQSIDCCTPKTAIPSDFQSEKGERTYDFWWREYALDSLNGVVESALRNNLELQQSWWQVVQACAQARIDGSARYPSIDLIASASQFNNSGFGFGNDFGGFTGFSGTNATSELYQLSGALTYEVDLWRRVDSIAKASCMDMYASREDLDAVALTLTGTVVDLWFTIQEQLKLLKVIDHQIEVSRTLLELVELRFSVGQSSALDVYQQRLQLADTESERPRILSQLATSKNQLRVLLGQVPESNCFDVEPEDFYLPPLPDVGSPIELLCNRPDLRAEQRRLLAADYRIAAAVADLYPRLDFSLSYGFQATEIRDLFNFELYRIAGEMLMPLFDAGRRRAQVAKQRAVLCESLSRYSQTFLTALKEVEDALIQEKYQLEFIADIENEIDLANKNLEEAKYRYVNGLNDYLTVIAAVQSLQGLERSYVTERKNLLLIRNKLYRSLGWIGDCRLRVE